MCFPRCCFGKGIAATQKKWTKLLRRGWYYEPGSIPSRHHSGRFPSRPHSVLVNEVIANALFKGGKTEGWGRGILDIFTLCKEAGLPEPEYDFVPNFVCLTIRFKEPITPRLSGDRHNDRPNDSRIDRLNKSVKATFLVIERNPGLQRKRIAELVGKSIPTIDRHLA